MPLLKPTFRIPLMSGRFGASPTRPRVFTMSSPCCVVP